MATKAKPDTPTFDPKAKLRSIKGRDYLDVKWRIAWMRSEHPDWALATTLDALGELIYVKATVLNSDGSIVATGMATVREAGKGEQSWAGREIEKAETAAIGRALAHAGYGTQFAEDDGDDLADAPVERPAGKAKANGQAERTSLRELVWDSMDGKEKGKFGSFPNFSAFAMTHQKALDDLSVDEAKAKLLALVEKAAA